jgi:hypothetical protein
MINLHLWIMDLRGGRQRQAPRSLLGDQENQKDLTLSVRSTKEFTGRLSRLVKSESIQVLPTIEFNSDSGMGSTSETNRGSFHGKLGSFLMGLWNTTLIHQEINSNLFQNSFTKLAPFPFGLNNMAKSC